ncbi:MAG: transcription termination/antitermination protein NusG [bacterium]
MAKEWYIIHTRAGQEDRVKKALERELKETGLDRAVGDVVVPTQHTEEEREKGKVRVQKKIYPRYVFIEMDYNVERRSELSKLIKNIAGVLGMIGGWESPQPLSDEEVNDILKLAGVEYAAGEVDISEGESVRILAGPFMDFSGTVDKVDFARAKVRVFLSLFGRETPVELDIDQVRKI